ncbi:hypothetical protein LguiA_024898 [Lonicera macranthoides]
MSICSCNNFQSPAFFLMFFLNQLIFISNNVLEKNVFTLVVRRPMITDGASNSISQDSKT